MHSRWRRALVRSATVVAGLTAFTLVTAGAALAFDSGGSPGSTGNTQINWTGQGAHDGKLDTIDCTGVANGGQDPFGDNKPYMLWVMTTGGGSVSLTSPPPVLVTSGSLTNSWPFVDPTKTNNVHFLSDYVTPDPATLHAFAAINVTDVGSTWNLVISHGCPGGAPEAAPLTISKTAAGDYTTTYLWNINKTVDTNEIDQAPGGATPFNYTVSVGHDAGTNSLAGVSGVITVSNPNNGDAVISDVTDTLSNGTKCNVPDQSGVTVPGNKSIDVNYTCTLDPGQPVPTTGLLNTANVDWADQTVSDGSHLAQGTGTFTFTGTDAHPDGIEFTQHLVDDSVTVSDSLKGDLGTVGQPE
jgi:hypothetical protein